MQIPEPNIITYKPLLFSIAYEILGDIKDAEDAVQETFLKWFERKNTSVEKIKPYLIATLKNTCLTWHKRASHLKEIKDEMAENMNKDYFMQLMDWDHDMDLSKAYQMLSNKLNITEKTVYLLRDIFDFEYSDIAEVMDRKAGNCRKILERARKKMQEKNRQLHSEAEKAKESFNHFKMACTAGNIHDMVVALKKEMEEKIDTPD